MSKKKERQSKVLENDVVEEKNAESTTGNVVESAVENSEETAKETKTQKTETKETKVALEKAEKVEKLEQVETEKMETKAETTTQPETVVVKKGGSGLALLSLLVALGLAGAGYYLGQQEVDKINQKVTALEQRLGGNVATAASPTAVEMPSFEQERSQITQLLNGLKANDEKLGALELSLADKEKNVIALQAQLNKVANIANAQPSDWYLNEAEFLLTNALRKLVLDNDVDTSVSLLKLADEALSKVPDAEVKTVRAALNQDLKQLLSVNSVDQNAIMQSLSQLANNVDELSVMNVDFGNQSTESTKVSDDVMDWKANLEKSANSFLNRFIRITPRSENATQALLAPNQDIYLRENIRLRLQIAILAVPRQQNELYKQSLETVAAWIRTYFDTNTETAANFLKSLDGLAEQSIYVNVPNQLNSLNALDKLLNKVPQEVKKIEISADKALTEANQVAAEEIKATEENKVAEETKVNEEKNAEEKPAEPTNQ